MSTSPYPGLRPFHRDEADIFFGRDEQVDQLLIRLGKSPFLAVVGPSGCGKSSLVHTGLLNALEAGFLAEAGLHWRIATMQPGSHPMRNLAEALVEHIGLDTDKLNTGADRDASPPFPSGDNAVDLSSAKPSTAGEGGIHLPLPSGEGRGEGFLKSANTNPPTESQITSFPDAGPSTANETPQHDDTAFLLAMLRRGPLGLIEVLREQPLPENTNLLLVVDQFEEIFRYREHHDRDEADAFVALLLRSVQDSEFPVYIVITMRSDFLGDCALFSGLPEALNDSQFLTPRLNREQRRLAITGPARVCGGDVEPALVNRLLNDMGADPDQLPVLQHALMRLWTEASKRDNKPVILKLNDYEALGGWDNTLSNHADEAFAELDKQQQTIAELLFRSLTERSGPRRDTRRPVSLQAVAGIAGVDMKQVIPVIEVFRRADRSFLMPPVGQPLTAETLIDISHESLIRQWQRMKAWVEQEAQSADTYRRLEQTALLNSQKRAGLLQGLDLFPVLEWKKLEQPTAPWAARYGKDFDQVMRFLAASQRWHRLKSILKFSVVAAIFLIAVGMTWLWHQADTERHKATGARLLAEGQLLRSQGAANHLSILLGTEAWKHYPHPHFLLNQFLLASVNMLPRPGHTLQHDGSVYKVVYSPDGKQLATESNDNTVRLWNAATGQELQRLSHDGPVKAVTFSPDSKQLATASGDKTARLWDTATGQVLQRLNHDGSVEAVTFSPDGNRLATASDDKTARLWDAATGQELQRLSDDYAVNAVTFSPDGKQLATLGQLWDTATGHKLQSLTEPGTTFCGYYDYEDVTQKDVAKSGKDPDQRRRIHKADFVTFSADGKQLATVIGGTMQLWDVATGRGVPTLCTKSAVYAVAFSPEGEQLATANEDKAARLWDTATGKELQRLNHDSAVYDVTFSPDGRQLATASKDKTARQWDAATGKELRRLNHDSAVYEVTFSPDGSQLATASDDNTARLWDTATGQEFQRLKIHYSGIRVTFSPDGKQLATDSFDDTVRLWDAATGQELQRLDQGGDVRAITFSPDGKQLAASSDYFARLWDAATGKELQHLKHDDNVNAVALSPDGRQLATANDDKTARLWDMATGKEVQRLNHDSPVHAVAFSPAGNRLATGEDNIVRLWDTATGQELQRLKNHYSVHQVTFSPDGKQLATTSSSSSDNTARLWDTATGKELQRLSHGYILAMSFSPDGKQLATASKDGTVRLWDATTGQELQLLNHDKEVDAVTFSPDGKLLATASKDKTARLWDTATGKEVQRLKHDSYVYTVTFSPDGKLLATDGSDGTARLWLWQPEDLIKQLCLRLLHNLTWDEWQSYFEDEPYRKTCEQLPVAPDYQEKGKQLIWEGKTTEAVRMIQQLNAADPALKLDQEQTLQKWTVTILEEAEQLLEKKRITEAIEAFNRVEQMDSKVISADSWNKLCRIGALGGYPAQVLDACEKGVNASTSEEHWMYQDSRGLARALTGNSQGAIEDFEFVIKNTYVEKLKNQRQAWVQALRAGQNPFTEEELAALRDQ